MISDKDKLLMLRSYNLIKFSIESLGKNMEINNRDQISIESLGKNMEINNRDQKNKFSFSPKEQEGFNRLALVITRF